MTAPLRLGLAGCGRLAELGYLPALRGVAELELVAVADPAAGRREAIARGAANGVAPATHDSLERLLAAERVDAVVIATPVAQHLRCARVAAAAGIPALLEKPPAENAAGAALIAELRPAPWIGFNRRFQHAAPLLERLPAAGPVELELELSYRRSSWRAAVARDDALLDLGPHLVDLALVLTGAGEVAVRNARLSAERAEIELATASGRATIRCATDRPHRERVVARRPDGSRLAASVAGGVRRGLAARLRRREHPLVDSLRAQLGAFAAVVSGAEAGLLASSGDGVRAMAVIDEARRVAKAPRGAVIAPGAAA